jgi:hypothetical protein
MSDTLQTTPSAVGPPQPSREDILQRVKAEFLEMPGLRLTEAQARRLWGLDSAMCATLLATLVDAKFLFRTSDGSVMRMDRARPLRAHPSSSDIGRGVA